MEKINELYEQDHSERAYLHHRPTPPLFVVSSIPLVSVYPQIKTSSILDEDPPTVKR